MLHRFFRTACVVSALAVIAAGCSGSDGGHSASLTDASIPHAQRKITHVFVINLENQDFQTTWGATSPAKYLNNTLRKKGQLLTQYYGIGHVSLDNYIAEISGQAPNPDTNLDCLKYTNFVSTGTSAYGQLKGKGCVFPKSVKTIADQLTAAGKTWKGYMEDIGNSASQPKTCRHPAIGANDTTIIPSATDMYATRHDPFVYFHSIIDSASCKTKVVGLPVLTTDLASAAKTPNFSFITPNVCDDGHDSPCKDNRPGGLKSADVFIQKWAPKILASPAYKAGGMLIITFDEAESGGMHKDATACCHTPKSPNSAKPGLTGPGGGRVGALVISSNTKANTTNAKPYNHYAMLCSIENVFGLSHLGFAGAPGLACFGKDVYNS